MKYDKINKLLDEHIHEILEYPSSRNVSRLTEMKEAVMQTVHDLDKFVNGFPRKNGRYDVKCKLEKDSTRQYIILGGVFYNGSFYEDDAGDLIAIHNIIGWREPEEE